MSALFRRLPGTRLAWSIAVLLVFAATPRAREPQAKVDPSSEEYRLQVMHRISSHTLLDWVKELASEKYGGRLTGTSGYEAAARWSIGLWEGWGLRAAGDGGTFVQKFPNPYTMVLPGAVLALHLPVANGASIEKPYVYERDYFPGSTSATGELTAEVVYVGYGITAPDLGYDDYAGMDVKGKIVLMEPEVPVRPDQEPEVFTRWRPYSFHDYKARNAKEHGAAGMLYNYHIANPNCVYLEGFLLSYISPAVVDDVFAGSGRDHGKVVEAIRTTRHPASFPTTRVVTMKNVTEHHPEGVGFNVVGFVEGRDPALRHDVIVIGAHLDHLGYNPELMPGAHDNASGDAVLLAVAEALAASGVPLKRSFLFILFGAEEQGVRGSEFFVAHPTVPRERIKAFINLESVGRGERLTAGSAQNFPWLWQFFDTANRQYIHRPVNPTFNTFPARPRQDAAHFFWAGIPTIGFESAGAPPLPFASYHTTKDTPAIITPEIMEDLARLVFLASVDMANTTTSLGSEPQ